MGIYNGDVMPLGKSLRWRRMRPRGRSVIVALDHGLIAGVAPGLERTIEIVKVAAGAGADGVLLTPGMLEQVFEELDGMAVVLRVDGAVSRLGPGGPMRLICEVEDAVRMGVDSVVVNATLGAPYESDELEKLGRLASESRRWGLPVVAEMLSERMLANHLDFTGSGEAQLPADIEEDVAVACRIGVELGADAIKTRYSGNVESFRKIVAAAGRPVLVAGGPLRQAGLLATLQSVDQALDAGAAGVIFGRSVWQHPDPGEVLRAICAMVHDDATVEEAMDAVTV